MTYETMTIAQLVAIYNERAETPVKKFKDKATAIARIKALEPAKRSTDPRLMKLYRATDKTSKSERVQKRLDMLRALGEFRPAEAFAADRTLFPGGPLTELKYALARGHIVEVD